MNINRFASECDCNSNCFGFIFPAFGCNRFYYAVYRSYLFALLNPNIYICIYKIKQFIILTNKEYIPMAKKHSIPTVRKIFSMTDGLELASMHLNTRNTEKRKRQTYVATQKPNEKNVAMKTVYSFG